MLTACFIIAGSSFFLIVFGRKSAEIWVDKNVTRFRFAKALKKIAFGMIAFEDWIFKRTIPIGMILCLIASLASHFFVNIEWIDAKGVIGISGACFALASVLIGVKIYKRHQRYLRTKAKPPHRMRIRILVGVFWTIILLETGGISSYYVPTGSAVAIGWFGGCILATLVTIAILVIAKSRRLAL